MSCGRSLSPITILEGKEQLLEPKWVTKGQDLGANFQPQTKGSNNFGGNLEGSYLSRVNSSPSIENPIVLRTTIPEEAGERTN